jgi:hypothetical protein
LTAQGKRTDNLRKQFPEITRAYDSYLTCRAQSALVVEVPRGKATMRKIVIYTSGYAQLPGTGGVLDQSHRLMALFAAFREGDALATSKALS